MSKDAFAALPQAERDALADAVAEWLQGRYGDTGAYMTGDASLGVERDASDDGWRVHATLLVALADAGADASGPLLARCRKAVRS